MLFYRYFFVSCKQMEGYIEIEKYVILEVQNKALKEQVESLKFQLEELKRMVFGGKSERYIPEVPTDPPSFLGDQQVEEKVVVPAHERTKKIKKQPVRLVLPPHLKREEEVIEPDVDLTNMVKIGEERTEILKYTPAELIVRVIIRPKYALKSGGEEAMQEVNTPVVIAPMPTRFIDKCMADESLLWIILTDKYLDHLPLYRIAARLGRLGMVIPRSTMSGWVAQCADKMQILYDRLVKLVLQSNYLQVDETRIEVLEKKGARLARSKPKKRKTHRGYQWGYFAPHKKLLFFDYSPTRGAENPLKNLKDFKGTIQTDCYDVYDQIRKLYGMIRHYHCLAHSRREFEKALGNDAKRAGRALEQFQQVYAVERQAREEGLDAEAIYELRQEKSRPVLEELFTWMEEESPKLPPRSPIAKAMGYMLKRKDRMMHYLTDGNLLIDNNPIENLVRPIAVGRRNYLFAGSHEGARRAAMFYSFFACCNLNDVNPAEWLADVMARLPEHPVNRIEELLPHRWKAMKKPKEKLLSSSSI